MPLTPISTFDDEGADNRGQCALSCSGLRGGLKGSASQFKEGLRHGPLLSWTSRNRGKGCRFSPGRAGGRAAEAVDDRGERFRRRDGALDTQGVCNEFEKRHGIRVVKTSPVDFGKLRAVVESGNVGLAVTEIDGQDATRAVGMGLVQPIDDKIVHRSSFPKEAQAKDRLCIADPDNCHRARAGRAIWTRD